MNSQSEQPQTQSSLESTVSRNQIGGAAVVGTGFIGPAHVEALRRAGVHVVGIAGSSPGRAQESARALGVETAYPSFEAVLADPRVQVVHLATPNHLHYEQAQAALRAGKHVICEKPLALNSEQSAALVRLAAETRRVGVVHFNLRYYPLVHQAREMVRAGELGEIFLVHGSYLQDWLLYPTDWNWRLETEQGGALRAVADIGSHWLDMTSFVSGLQVQAVMADFQTFHPVRKKPRGPVQTFSGAGDGMEYEDVPIRTEDYASVLLRYENGARGACTISQVSAGRKNRLFFEINGSKASLAWNSERPNELWIGRRDKASEVLLKDPALLDPSVRDLASYPGGHNEGFPDTLKQLYRQVYAYLQRGDLSAPADFPTFEDGHRSLLLGEAILRSAQQGRWEEVVNH